MTVDATAASPLVPDERFALPARHQQLTRAADALARHGFAVEILDDAGAARARIRDLLQQGSTVFTSASETLRLSGIDDDINTSGRYHAIKPLVRSMDRATRMDEIRSLMATPQVVVGSVAAVTETGSLVAASASEGRFRRTPEALLTGSGSSAPRRSFRTSIPRCAASRRMPIRLRTFGHAPSTGSRAR